MSAKICVITDPIYEIILGGIRTYGSHAQAKRDFVPAYISKIMRQLGC